MTIAVCDSGPLTHLWQIEMWATLGTFEEIHLAEQVAQEVRAHVPIEDLGQCSAALARIHEVSQERIDLLAGVAQAGIQLEPADLATLALARDVRPELVLTDDLTLRRAVELDGHVPMGSVGVLLRAYKAQILDAERLDRAIDGLFVHSTLYLSSTFKAYVRRLIVAATNRSTS